MKFDLKIAFKINFIHSINQYLNQMNFIQTIDQNLNEFHSNNQFNSFNQSNQSNQYLIA